MDIKEYKCPNCNGTVPFHSVTQTMKCPSCDVEFETAALDDYQKELAASATDHFGWGDAAQAGQAWEGSELDDLSQGSCPSCGAELVGDANTIAMVCPYCGNAQILKKRLSGLLKPDYVIPFQLEKKDAVNAFKKFYEEKRLIPDCFKEENHLDSIQGVYVPFWLFDAKAHGHIRYKATKTKSWSDSKYHYTQTDVYSVVRDGSLGFEKIPVDGSEKMDDSAMDALEPFDYAQLKDFQSTFLAGYSAEKYDVDAEVSKDRAKQRIKSTVETEFAESVGDYSSVSIESSTVKVEGGNVRYTLFPVWVLNTKYQKKNYQVIMNGQSGRMVGKLPVDEVKAKKYLLLYTGVWGVVFTLAIQVLRYVM